MSALSRVDRILGPVTWVCAGALVVMLFVGPIVVAEDKPSAAAPAGSYTAPNGKALFEANCGSCHTLSAAGTSGTVGPKLDGIALDQAAVRQVMLAGPGVMPEFGDTLSAAQIDAVAAFVAQASG